SPFYKAPPGSTVSSIQVRFYGAVTRRLRRITNEFMNREVLWEEQGRVPTGWGKVDQPPALFRLVHAVYDRLRLRGAEPPGRERPEEQYAGGYEVPGVVAKRRRERR
ncbi:MAG: hypothetical protein C4315_12545, partial [Chloroflexota bacterium]